MRVYTKHVHMYVTKTIIGGRTSWGVIHHTYSHSNHITNTLLIYPLYIIRRISTRVLLMQYHTLQVYLIITVTILALHVASLQFNNRCILQIVRYACFILILYLSISIYIFIFNLCTHCMF